MLPLPDAYPRANGFLNSSPSRKNAASRINPEIYIRMLPSVMPSDRCPQGSLCITHARYLFFIYDRCTQDDEDLDPEDVELDEHYTLETRSKCEGTSSTSLWLPACGVVAPSVLTGVLGSCQLNVP